MLHVILQVKEPVLEAFRTGLTGIYSGVLLLTLSQCDICGN